ncbi:hypothetical protein KDL01_03980 [Actinospica durhamensis]|uniref:Uncharacterized protein n=1 Tax=Actinospica durhamensis TaxID=1508375 RepID=A0A941EJL0_9ACTN|nr:hypothetical protein [Actinospica durhamensis]MBR7832401.1 hypothetical protein [Actinospica durhamensis]
MLEYDDLAGAVRQWRPSTTVRLVGGWVAIAGLAVAASTVAAWARGDLAPGLAALGALAGTLAAWFGYGYLHRFRIALGNGLLTVVGVWCTYRIPLQYVVGARATRAGVLFELSNGGRCLAGAVAAPSPRADAAVNAVLAASATERSLQELGDGRGAFGRDGAAGVAGARPRGSVRIPGPPPPILATIGLIGRITSRSPRATVIRYALCWLLLAAAYGAFFVAQDSDAATTSTAPTTLPQLKVGDCLTDSADPSTITPCTSPHTGQVFMVADYTPGISCDKSDLDQSRLPSDASYSVITVWNGTSRTSCLVVTSAITWSVVKSS